MQVALFGCACLLGSLLVFLIQPLVGRVLLPHFGGSPGTWLVCLLFFQLLLFAGYLYVHLTTRLARLGTQVAIQSALLLGALLLPWELPALEPSSQPPEWTILAWLGAAIGLPYLMVTTGAPLLQRWLGLLRKQEPYRLYALSNAGSLLGLLVFPFLLEPLLGLTDQMRLWRIAFAAFAVIVVGCGIWTWRRGPRIPQPVKAGPGQPLAWLGLSAVPSALLLSTTNHLTIDVPPMPLLWIAPLGLYLVSFILCFSSQRFHRPALWTAIWIASCGGIAISLFQHGTAPLIQQLAVSLLALFSGCMLCHGELFLRRPAAADLTRYYVWIAGGGAIGGLLVAIVAPRVFSGYFELQGSLLATFAVLLWSFPKAGTGAVRWLRLGVVVLLPVAVATHWTHGTDRTRRGRVVEHRRDFHGILRVTRLPEVTILTHGRIRHGMQFRDTRRALWPTMYYGRNSGMGVVLERHKPGVARRLGGVGLGVGTLAIHARHGDTLTFYELSQSVVEVAHRHFTFLSRSPAEVHIDVGDGRQLLAALPDQNFDVLVIDAFSSDAIPVHLLTREAFALYARHLAPDGILLTNTSNRHLRIDRVVAGSAAHNGLHLRILHTPVDVARGVTRVRWAIMARSSASLDALLEGTEYSSGPPALHWTDERSGLFELL